VYLQSVEGFRNDAIVGRRYGYLAPEVIAEIPPEHRDPAWSDKPLRRHDPAIFAALLRHSDRAIYFTNPPDLPHEIEINFLQEGLLYRAVRSGEDWQPSPDIWDRYTWHTLDCADTRGDNTARIIVAEIAFAQAAEQFRAGNICEAVALLDEGITCYGADVRLLNNAGTMCARHGQYEAAEGYFVRALEAYPVHPAATANLTRLRRLTAP
jgi:tetratricopeptide (TPR) repeat protein